MEPDDFARRFGSLYRELYLCAVRRVPDARERLSAETTALLLHLAQAGPSTLSELTRHLDRSPSTLSAKVASLEQAGLLARQRDDDDARRSLIWLTPRGRADLLEALDVLDAARLADAARALDPQRRRELVGALHQLVGALRPTPESS